MIIDFNCGERHEDVIYHRSYTHDLSICEIKARKKKMKLFDFFQALISQLRKLCVSDCDDESCLPICQYVSQESSTEFPSKTDNAQ